jgi:hypothetical protein
LAGGKVSVRVENVGEATVDDVQVAIGSRRVFHSVAAIDGDVVELSCQAPRVDVEGFQSIVVTCGARSTRVDDVLYYAAMAPLLQDASTPSSTSAPTATKDESISMAELDDIDAFLDSDAISALTIDSDAAAMASISTSKRSWGQ